MSIATKRNKYGLDPFQICFPQYQKYYGKGEADSPWPLLLRTIYNILYAKSLRDRKKSDGVYADKKRIESEISVKPKDWAFAFNAACKTLREASPPRIAVPNVLDPDGDPGDFGPVFSLLGPGKQKVKNYRTDPEERRKTIAIVYRMHKHMKSIAKDLPEDYRDQLP